MELTLTERRCPVCDSSTYMLAFNKDGYSYVRCTDCGTTYINPGPAASVLAELYDSLGEGYFRDPRRLVLDFAKEKYLKEIAFLQRVSARLRPETMGRERLLEVGCATGSFLIVAQQLGFAVVQGLDISRPAIEHAQSLGLDAVVGNFTTTDRFVPGSCDVIVMWATLEHLPDPRAFVRRAYDLLAANGLLLASVPNSNSLTAKLLGAKSRYVLPQHLNYFTASSLARLFTGVGFRVVYHETQSINPVVIWGDLRGVTVDANRHTSDYQRTHVLKSNPLLAPVRWLHAGADRLLRWTGRGDLLLMAGQKQVPA